LKIQPDIFFDLQDEEGQSANERQSEKLLPSYLSLAKQAREYCDTNNNREENDIVGERCLLD
jgi:hypothetical protein